MSDVVILCAPLLLTVAVTYGFVRLFGRRLARRDRGFAIFASAAPVPALLFILTMIVVARGKEVPHDGTAYAAIGLLVWTIVSIPLSWLISAAFIYKPERETK